MFIGGLFFAIFGVLAMVTLGVIPFFNFLAVIFGALLVLSIPVAIVLEIIRWAKNRKPKVTTSPELNW